MNKAQISISTYGNGIAVGIDGDKDSIAQAFNRFFNWGAAANGATTSRTSDDSEMSNGDMGDSYLHFIGERFAYFLTTEKAILAALLAEGLAQSQDTDFSRAFKAPLAARKNRRNSGKAFANAVREKVTAEIAAWPRENFMLFGKNPMSVYNELDGGAPSWVAETED